MINRWYRKNERSPLGWLSGNLVGDGTIERDLTVQYSTEECGQECVQVQSRTPTSFEIAMQSAIRSPDSAS